MPIRNKIIWVLSPQSWGTMFLAKHHYAVELAKRGNKVFFINPPEQQQMRFGNNVTVKDSGIEGLTLVQHSLSFPYWLKFKSPKIFHELMRWHLKRMERQIGAPELVWSFDLNNVYPLPFFRDAIRIFHPVDEPSTNDARRAAEGAQIIFGVTPEILSKYNDRPVPKYEISHGVASEFIHRSNVPYRVSHPVKVGLSGNLLRPDIDREVLLNIIDENPSCEFHFWGSHSAKQSNIGGASDSATTAFIEALRQRSSVRLHGVVSPEVLAEEIRGVDLFLICYDVQKDQSKGTNYHKIMEYVGTGRVTVSNNVTAYASHPDLVRMVKSRTDNKELPGLFRETVANLLTFNSSELMDKRISFAEQNLYAKKVEEIEGHLLREKLID